MPKKKDPANVVRDYAALAGMSDDAVVKNTGRGWREWVALLDAEKSAEKPHREIARFVASLGTSPWWAQSVTVGYERIRGLRAIGQRRGGAFEANKSRTFAVPVERLYAAFANARTRAQWLPADAKVRSASANERVRLTMADQSSVEVNFTVKSESKTAVAVQHSKLRDRAAVERMKAWWAERFDALAKLLG